MVVQLGYACLSVLVKYSRVCTQFDWQFIIPKMITAWPDTLNRRLVPMYTSNHVFEAFQESIDWSCVVDALVNFFIVEACQDQLKMSKWTDFVHKFGKWLTLLWRNRYLLRHIYYVHPMLIAENCGKNQNIFFISSTC